jgi:hypothetical protein
MYAIAGMNGRTDEERKTCSKYGCIYIHWLCKYNVGRVEDEQETKESHDGICGRIPS